MIFGETIPTGVQLSGFWVVIMFGASLLGNLSLVAVLFLRDRKREIHWGFEPASKRDFEKHVEENKKEHDRFDRRLDGADREVRKEIEKKSEAARLETDSRLETMRKETGDSLTGIHERINQILEAVGELRGEVKAKRGI